MELGLIGLGRMGANMSRRLVRGGHHVVGLRAPRGDRLRASWPTAPSRRSDVAGRPGQAAGGAARRLADGARGGRRRDARPARALLAGQGRHRDRRRQLVLRRRHPAGARASSERGVHYVDCGTSGGVFGLERGYCLMIGGPDEAVARLRPDLRDARAGHRRGTAHGRPREPRRHRRGGLPPLRPERRRPLREDGPQRHRVRDHGRLRRGPQRPAPRRRRAPRGGRSTPRRAPCATPSSTGTTSTWPT